MLCNCGKEENKTTHRNVEKHEINVGGEGEDKETDMEEELLFDPKYGPGRIIMVLLYFYVKYVKNFFFSQPKVARFYLAAFVVKEAGSLEPVSYTHLTLPTKRIV